MKKILLLSTLLGLLTVAGFAQDKFWSATTQNRSSIVADKAVARQAYPQQVKLFTLNFVPFKQAVLAITTGRRTNQSTIISLPNADGNLEDFEVLEASNFEPALQSRFPEIRAYSGKGITDKAATLKLSISPQGIETMVFRTDKDNEFMEPYSQDHTVYAVYRSHRAKGVLPWRCDTEEKMAFDINDKVKRLNITHRSTGDLKILRLAQSVTAEYSNYFGATSASQVGLVLAAINNTLTRCNGVYEKDLALHLNLIANTTSVIYYDASTDPYSPGSSGAGGAWNSQLQNTLTSVIGEANYDIGHLFGASGGGGNAGCIGCVCDNGSKGSGFTSPADGIPQGDNFDIDYVVHEVGHQLGGNHTFSYRSEGTGVNDEIGSGITIMGYAGITAYDVGPHSIDIYHAANIAQIQANLANKTCPVTLGIINATPMVAPVSNYTIPMSTPFALTGSATDANTSDVLTYCWEQMDDGSAQTGSNSKASATKTSGPNFISFKPTISATRYFPQLSTILAGNTVTGPFAGGDAGMNSEALSSVARTLNFRLTVRDNAPYTSSAPASVGQTQFTDMAITVDATSGPFSVTSPNTAVTWASGSTQNITWSVANTTAAPVSCANVKISLSTDGGLTFPFVLVASTPNDGSEPVTIPGRSTTTARIKVEAVGNVFFDISNTNFTITCTPPASVSGFGSNQWNVDVWNAGGASINSNSWSTNYSGYYNSAELSINTQNNWNKEGAPSDAAGYTGCAVANDNHSYSARRQGFPCGYYQLDVPGHDDAAQLFINGINVWEHNGCCDSHSNVWSGWLGSNDKVEFKVTEGTGQSYGQLSFNLSTSITNGNPAIFGNNQWNVYAWNAGGAHINSDSWSTNYSGYYTTTDVNFNTQSNWDDNGAPSDAMGFVGCPVAIDNHSYSAKRQGFPCGYYTLDVPGHDDAAQLYINGTKVWEHDDCCDAHSNVWSGWLGANDSAEFRITEGSGESYGLLNFIPTPDTLYTWLGKVDREWNNSANWGCGMVPPAGSDVIIPNTALLPVLSANETIGNLKLLGRLTLNGKVLTINGAVTGTGTFKGSATSGLVIAGNAGTLNFTAGSAILYALTINTGASATVAGNVTITGP